MYNICTNLVGRGVFPQKYDSHHRILSIDRKKTGSLVYNICTKMADRGDTGHRFARSAINGDAGVFLNF